MVLLVTFSHGDSEMAMEKNIWPLNFMLLLPLCVELFRSGKRIKIQRIFKIGLMVLISLSALKVYKMKDFYIERIDHLRGLISQVPDSECRKWLVKSEYLNSRKLHVKYALSVESLLLTSIEKGSAQISIHSYKDKKRALIDLDVENRFYFVDSWPYIEMEELNRSYFNLPEGPYCSFPVPEQ